MFNKKKRENDKKLEDQKLPAKNAPKSGVVLPLSDDEPTEKFRLWWSENGKSIIAGVTLGVVAIIGYQYWQSHKATKAIGASTVFSEVLNAFETDDFAEVTAQSNILVDDFGGTDYAAQGQVLSGIVLLKDKKVEEAVTVLQDALTRAKNPVTEHLSRLNLAKAFIEKGSYDDAISTLNVTNVDGYQLQYDELKADTYALKGDAAQAKESYQKVLDSLGENDAYREVVNVKVNQL